MGWCSGSDLADRIWSLVKDHIPKEAQPKIALRIIEIFEGEDCDTMQETALWDLCHEDCDCWVPGDTDPDMDCEKCEGHGTYEMTFDDEVEDDEESE